MASPAYFGTDFLLKPTGAEGRESTVIKLLCSAILGFMLFSVVGHSVQAKAESGYGSYCNGRYGFCLSYPNFLEMEAPPANDDGRRFRDHAGFTVTVSGINNVLEDTLEDGIRTQSEDFDSVSYREKHGNWFVLSGIKGDRILYIKTYLGKGSINHLCIEYPAGQKMRYDDAVARISRSFKPGRLDIAH